MLDLFTGQDMLKAEGSGSGCLLRHSEQPRCFHPHGGSVCQEYEGHPVVGEQRATLSRTPAELEHTCSGGLRYTTLTPGSPL